MDNFIYFLWTINSFLYYFLKGKINEVDFRTSFAYLKYFPLNEVNRIIVGL